MKWNEQQIIKLREMCQSGISNQEMAVALKCKLTDVYNKRSQLGITIDKCKTQPITPKNAGLNKAVKDALQKVYKELLLVIASDWTSDDRGNKYAEFYYELLELESKYEKLLKGEINGQK